MLTPCFGHLVWNTSMILPELRFLESIGILQLSCFRAAKSWSLAVGENICFRVCRITCL